MEHHLKKYLPIAHLIARTFGKQCEAVIHDLTIPQNSVVYCINNHVTGREVGQSFEHLVRQVLLSPDFADDCTANYYFSTSDGRLIKSSTALLRDEGEKATGALCINIDVTAMGAIAGILSDFLSSNEKDGFVTISNESIESVNSVFQIVKDLITHICKEDGAKLNRAEKLELVKFMNTKDIFLVKGAIDIVAEKLDLSKITVYSYLNELKKCKDTDTAE